MTNKHGFTSDQMIDFVEKQSPGFKLAVEEARKELYAAYPDKEQRMKYVLAYFVNIEDLKQ